MSSDPERWRRVRAVFEEALDVPEEERSAFVGEACGGDPELETEVRELLRQAELDATTDGFLRTPGTREAAAATLERVSESWTGKRVAGYEIRRVLASGGMGTVFEAVQDSPQRTVALKMVHVGSLDERALRRFRVEAELLGRLRHPNIAQVYEAGTFQASALDGAGERPFIAMELVDGARSIFEYATEQRLGTSECLRLFGAVCAGVHHAHQKGVIHRDLKPGNLLVGADGIPKVIDFGVALAQDLDRSASQRSLPGTVVGTLLTMSPEQVDASGEVDTRTDVYALGVVLFRLLCGEWPYAIEGANLATAARTIHEAEPRRPRALAPHLPPDVEWILVKALEKDKDDRYASASELAADLRRVLKHEPVLAGPPTTVYRLRKFVRRNPAWATVLLALVLGLVGTAIGLRRATVAKREAQDARVQAERDALRASTIADFFSDLFLSTEGIREGRNSRVSDLLEVAAAELDQAITQEADPRVIAELRHRIGASYHGLTIFEEAEPHLRDAVGRFLELEGEDGPSAIACAVSLGLCQLGGGDVPQAEATLAEAVARARAVLGPASTTACDGERALGVLYYREGRYAEAAELFRGNAEAARELEGDDGDRTQQALVSLAGALLQIGELEEAAEVSQRVIAARRRTLGEDHPLLLNSLNTRAAILKRLGRLLEARDLHASVLAARRRTLGVDHRSTVISLLNVAALERDLEHGERVEELLQEALDILLHGRFDADLLAVCADQLSKLLASGSREAEARAVLVLAGERMEEELDPSHPAVVRIRDRLESLDAGGSE